jgi:large subunit ribosomal protein L23
MAKRNAYSFRVPRTANKVEIRNAVEKLFEVKVESVNTLHMRGKWKIRGRTIGRSQEWKKAMVTLAKGNTIETF